MSLLLFFIFVRNYPTLDVMFIQFDVNRNTLNNTLMIVMKPCHSMFNNKFIEEITVEDLIKVLKYLEARLIIDTIVNRIHVPSGNFEDKKLFFSGKYKSCCLKSQIITNRQGLCLLIHSGFAGSYHDFRIFNEKIGDVKKLFDKHSISRIESSLPTKDILERFNQAQSSV
jgi:hypothetical protein